MSTSQSFQDIIRQYFTGPVTEANVDFSKFLSNLQRDCEHTIQSDVDEVTRLRCKFLLCRCDMDSSGKLAVSVLEDLKRIVDTLASDESPESLLECAMMAVTMEDEPLATDLIKRCKSALHFDYQLSGFMGKKSRHQENQCAILMVKIMQSKPKTYQANHFDAAMNCSLQDEDLFDTPQVSDTDSTIVGELECILLLINAAFVDKFETRDDASAEKIDAYLLKVLQSTTDWAIQRHALYVRSLNEAKRPKYMDRSMRQLRALLESSFSCDPSNESRQLFFNMLTLPDIYALKRDVALSLARHGHHLQAADMLSSLKMINQAAVCFINGGKRDSAIALLRKECDRDGDDVESVDPTACCLLGDLVDDQSWYLKAWTASKETFFPALRALGLCQYKRGDTDMAMETFKQLTINNPSHTDNWFMLGCCQLQREEWQAAIDSLTRVIAADHDHSQAWNNMAAIHLHLNNLEAAQHALKMSARLEFDAWRIWDNLFRVSLRLGDLFECVLAIQRLLELRGREGGFAPFLALVNRLADFTADTTDDARMQSLFKSIDCLVSWMDKLFSDDHDYLWLKSEYLLFRRDSNGRLECCVARHALLLSKQDYSMRILDALAENLDTIRGLSSEQYRVLLEELPSRIPAEYLSAVQSKFAKH